jgi:hypothetical protein
MLCSHLCNSVVVVVRSISKRADFGNKVRGNKVLWRPPPAAIRFRKKETNFLVVHLGGEVSAEEGGTTPVTVIRSPSSFIMDELLAAAVAVLQGD